MAQAVAGPQTAQGHSALRDGGPPGTGPFAQVAVLAQLGKAGGLFTYRVPEGLAPLVGAGSLVRVPFASRSLQGVVCSLERECTLPRVRDVSELLDPVPVVTAHGLNLAQWIAEYYGAPLSDVLGAMIPPGLGRKTVYILEPGSPSERVRLSPDQQVVADAVHSAGRVTQDDLQRVLPGIDVEGAVASMVRRRVLVRLSELAPPRVAARIQRIVSLTPAGDAVLDSGEWPKRALRQREALELLRSHGPLPSAQITHLLAGAGGVVTALEKRGLVHVETRQVSRSPIDRARYPSTAPLNLGSAQREALTLLTHSIDRRDASIFLLHGVTGSGKTEVYLQAVAHTIRSGRQAIMMVPEISLTPQAVERVAGRFPGRVAVLHSKLTPGERLDEWQRIRHGDVDVVVGPRSALFAPLPHPGLIVVDEEHDPSYKQDSTPRYNARDAAAVLGRFTGATVMFGSATPDIVTYHAARSGRITLLEMPDRPDWGGGGSEPRPMPPVEVVDMRMELKMGNRGMFSEALMNALDETLQARQQSLLFLNRRGNATIVLCRDCGYVSHCPHCDIPFTYHSSGARLLCHRCDKRAVSPANCPACDSRRIRYLGVGTQRVEEEVQRLFPHARVLRWDRDVTGGKDAHDRILRSFAKHEADILVGTQMIAKGLDFPLVTLVGVVSADTGLHMPDFRAPERSFQLLTQVAGRAGRSNLSSRVVVQTYTPDHYAIEAARDHDYHRFYNEEMSFRDAARYPPFGRLIRFVYSSENETQCRQSAENLRAILDRAIRDEAMTGAEVIGPAPNFVARIKNRYYWQVIARSGVNGTRPIPLHPLLDYVPPGWAIDVDPVDLL